MGVLILVKFFWFVGHNFLGCGSYDLKCWQSFSPMSPLPSYTYLEAKNQAIDPSLCCPKLFEKKQVHDYEMFSVSSGQDSGQATWSDVRVPSSAKGGPVPS